MKIPLGSRLPLTGFTIIELMVVVIIIGLLAGLVLTQVAGRSEQAKVTAAKAQIAQFVTSLELFRMDNGFYPSTEQGLEALVEKPAAGRSAERWNPEGYLTQEEIPLDPWGHPYIYVSPGEHGPFDVVSLGADGAEGGDGYDADVGSWQLSKEVTGESN